jgi:Xaa-Pro aminopeptidase
MRYEPLPAKLYKKNRKKFMAKMKPKSIAVFNSNDIYPISADSTLPFAQHRDIFYLTGVDQEESILLLFPDAPDKNDREILFLRETNDKIKVWEGEKLTKEKARELTGIKNIQWLQNFDAVLKKLAFQAKRIYINTNEHYRASTEVETREDRFIKKAKAMFPGHKFERSNPILQRLRSVKEPEEIAQIQKACDITEAGFRRILDKIQPGMKEYELEAEFAHEFIRRGSTGFAYTPIIASGNNANVLHYIQNDAEIKDGDLVLMDVGAEYGLWASDMTRCVPANGKFTPRQKEVYEAVLRVKDAAAKMLKPGVIWAEYQEKVGRIMEKELIKLGLLTEEDIKNEDPDWPAYKKYFMHGTSHHMGLDTHDYGILEEPMKAGMVFTVEPGIYIPEEGIGVRIEDDYVIQEKGEPINLMKNIPITVEEIEALMAK